MSYPDSSPDPTAPPLTTTPDGRQSKAKTLKQLLELVLSTYMFTASVRRKAIFGSRAASKFSFGEKSVLLKDQTDL
ncbi:hypothetical protein TNCV_532601 [Trichonephila clavipes]|nr:hypothetical protein TNCV_532601 [Trichonephila clavipes]